MNTQANQSDVSVTVADGVMEIRLNRPSKLNAMHRQMYLDAATALRQASASKDIRAILFSAEGAHFCAGNDLDDFFLDYSIAPGQPWRDFIEGLALMPKPVIAAVQGRGVGIGLTMLLHCDAVFVEPDIRISAPFMKLGLCPEAGSSLLLPRRVGYLRAMEVFTGRELDAASALAWGLVTKISEKGASRADANATAAALAAAPPQAFSETKRLVRGAPDELMAVIAKECDIFYRLLRSPETQDTLRALKTAILQRKV